MTTPPGSLPDQLRRELESLVQQKCGESLAAAVKDLTTHHSEHETVIEEWLASIGEQSDDAATASVPETIGPYRVEKLLGAGGMGRVYLAEESGAVRRHVALKLIKLGMDSEAVLRRFDQERQALARMDHPSIAKVYAAGVSDEGQPYFAMEFVDGVAITSYCNARKITMRGRIELMRKVCDAVQHAHQKGVLHRDITAGNVLVHEVDGVAEVKIIDFGLAKAIEDPLVERPMKTATNQRLGTPAYMAPECLNGASDADTRSDVYSLGVLLYELLVGALPFDASVFSGENWAHVLSTTPAPRPSTRLSALAKQQERIAADRSTNVSALKKAMGSDLEYVVMTAMSADIELRFASASSMAADLGRYLAGEPLEAGPASLGYRLRKWVARYRAAVAWFVALMLAIVGGAVISIYLWLDLKAEDMKRRRYTLEGRTTSTLRSYEHALAQPLDVRSAEQWIAQARTLVRDANEWRGSAELPTSLESLLEYHPRHADLVQLERWVEAARRTHAASLDPTFTVPTLAEEHQKMSAQSLRELAWHRIAPRTESRATDQRTVFGEEPLGLAFAMAALGKAVDERIRDEEHMFLRVMGYACLANGQRNAGYYLERAVQRSDLVRKTRYQAEMEEVQRATANPRFERFAVEGAYRHLREEMLRDVLPSWSPGDMTIERQLVVACYDPRLARIEHELLPTIERELAWSRYLDSSSDEEYWHRVSREIQAAEAYAGSEVEFIMERMRGWRSLGQNEHTGLWEFYHLRSAWDGECDPATITLPERDPFDGTFKVTEQMGIIAVLVPGGRFHMGTTPKKGDQNYYRRGENDEFPVHEVELDPYLIARHELTIGQWARLRPLDMQPEHPGRFPVGHTPAGGLEIDLTHPAQDLDWHRCDQLLRLHGLMLPTEAQWECACRAGTSTPWFCELEELRHYANLYDQSFAKFKMGGRMEPWNDGHIYPAPVGSFRPSPWGLHDMNGNVAEWCRDNYGHYANAVRAGDGLRFEGDPGLRVYRGGTHQQNAIQHGRSGSREYYRPDGAFNGVRAAMSLQVAR